MAFEEALALSPFARVLSSASNTTLSNERNVVLGVPMNKSCEESTRCFAVRFSLSNILYTVITYTTTLCTEFRSPPQCL